MPELPDVTIYLEQLDRRVRGHALVGIRLRSPFLLRSVEPPLRLTHGKRVLGVRRLGKRLVLDLEGELFLVLHLMIGGRLHFKPVGAKLPGKIGLAAFDFDSGSLLLTEASGKKRAWLRLVHGEAALADLDPGGIEPQTASLAAFSAALTRERHTLKRTLTDPRVLSGIGNAYSDEILHRARLSPTQLTTNLDAAALAGLHQATQAILLEWTERLRAETGDRFPERVTAFRPEMAVHGKYGAPCPRCGAKVQRIVYAANETNYCAPCQTGGKLLADRSLSKLLKGEWPKTLEELEEWKRESRKP